MWWHDDAETGWVVLVFEEIDGKHPAQPWRTDELDRVVDAMAVLADALTPSPLSTDIIGTASEEIENQICGWQLKGEDAVLVSRLDAWSARHLDTLAQIEAGAGAAAAGNTMLNFDIRADNILLTPDRVWFLDWPWARVGAAWIDVVFFAPSVTMQGGPPPEQVCARHPAYRAADPEAITAVVASIAGYFTVHALRPPPPGLPTVRAFQAAQGVVAREWLSERTGLS